MSQPKANILECIGDTPIVRLNKIAPDHVELYVKIEAANPMASVKDRLALGVIEAAEADGSLQPGQTVVEATSGNTGIGLAMVCAQKGYPLVIVMAENFSVERRKLMRYLGAKVVLTPAAAKGSGMVAKAEELAKEHGWFLTRQFDNPANAEIHARTTAVEIIDAFGPDGLDYFVSGVGTGGTLNGVARRLAKDSPQTKVIGCEPDNSPVLRNWRDQKLAADGSADGSHPDFRPHPVQGWAPDFVSKLSREALESGNVDTILPTDSAEALDLTRRLAREEGIFCGISSGATLAAALQVAAGAAPGSKILAMLPDTGERYQSTILFDDIDGEMSQEELAISKSTDNYRFDVAAAVASNPPPELADDHPGLAHMDRLLAENGDKTVTMFALKWCEFCGSAKRALDAMGLAYEIVDVDQPDWQGETARNLRQALHARTGQPTLPQMYLGDELIGGASDLFDKDRNGELAEMASRHGARLAHEKPLEMGDYLPAWMARR